MVIIGLREGDDSMDSANVSARSNWLMAFRSGERDSSNCASAAVAKEKPFRSPEMGVRLLTMALERGCIPTSRRSRQAAENLSSNSATNITMLSAARGSFKSPKPEKST